MVYNHGKAERKWKVWKEKEEKILRDSGVTEDTIEASTDQAEPKTVQDFPDHIENQELYHVLITVDRLKEKVQNDVWIAVFMQLFLVALDKIIFRD